jgi:acid phosphatase family membrane protein YuiD
MDFLKDFFSNRMIVVSIIAWVVAQLLKIVIHLLAEREFKLERLFGDGGMPSAHSSTVMALVTICGWQCGFNSGVFAVSIIVAIIVMHDAMGVRRETGKQSSTIKQIAEILNGMFAGSDKDIRTEKLNEFVGHSPLQVFFGGILGIMVAALHILIASLPYNAQIPLF